jgi:hypothetical protein
VKYSRAFPSFPRAASSNPRAKFTSRFLTRPRTRQWSTPTVYAQYFVVHSLLPLYLGAFLCRERAPVEYEVWRNAVVFQKADAMDHIVYVSK